MSRAPTSSASSNATQRLSAELQQRWQGLAPRERLGLQAGALVLGAALLWSVALAPALNTLRQAEARQQTLDRQWQQMQQLKAQAQALQQQSRLPRHEAVQALEASVRQRLGASAQLNLQGDRATLVLKNTPAEALSQWLAQARANARVLPGEARLTRSPPPGPGTAPPKPGSLPPGPAWDGTLVLQLPPA